MHDCIGGVIIFREEEKKPYDVNMRLPPRQTALCDIIIKASLCYSLR